MGWWPIAVSGVLYVMQAWYYYSTAADWRMGLVFCGYALANVGLVMDYMSKTS